MIIGVAVKVGELCIALPKPNRHKDCIELILSLGLVKDAMQINGDKQGFYDEQGKFYTRPEAAKHAFEIGQVTTDNCLVSEQFWDDAVDLSAVEVGDTLHFIEGNSAVVRGIHAVKDSWLITVSGEEEWRTRRSFVNKHGIFISGCAENTDVIGVEKLVDCMNKIN